MSAVLSNLNQSQGSNTNITIEDRRTPELVIALVGPVGSGVTTTANIVAKLLGEEYDYKVFRYKLSEFITSNASLVGVDPATLQGGGATRVSELQNAGDLLRQKFSGSYLAAKCVEKIAINRLDAGGYETVGDPPRQVIIPKRVVHIVDSLKNPEELALLRDVYGGMFSLIGVFAPENVRERRLISNGIRKEDVGAITSRDEKETESHGQDVRGTFYRSDFFIRNDADNDERLTTSLQRYIEILFGHPAHTPTKDESSMEVADSASASSACMSRQVGAAIINDKGELIGVGWNDVPKFKGGLYHSEDGPTDNRCFKWGGKLCHNDAKKSDIYSQVFKVLKELIPEGVTQKQITEKLNQTTIRSLIEFSRAVHAEMEAIISVGRANKEGLVGATLYSTCFPCHSCARHILASGITRLVYIEPYPKSLATELHADAISLDEKDIGNKLVFQQYEGVAPKNLIRLFKKEGMPRKRDDGKVREFSKKTALPLFQPPLDSFTQFEQLVIKDLQEKETAQPQQRNLEGL